MVGRAESVDEQGLRQMAEAGLLVGVRFYPHPERENAWSLKAVYGEPLKEHTLISYRKSPRWFKNLASIMSFSKELKIGKIEFILDGDGQ